MDENTRGETSNSSILWQNHDQTVTLLDIPHSIELAQQFAYCEERKLWSSYPTNKPYPSLEPKSKKALAAVKTPDIDDLILQRVLSLALEEAADERNGSGDGSRSWYRARSCHDIHASGPEDEIQIKRQCINSPWSRADHDGPPPQISKSASSAQSKLCVGGDSSNFPTSSPFPLPRNSSGRTITLDLPDDGLSIIPKNSTYIPETIAVGLLSFIDYAPQFPLIIMDPPWPNRSVRRAGPYQTSYGTAEIRELLSSIPVRDKLAEDGLVGVWVTNKPAFRTLLLGKDGEGGLFEEWGVKLVEEWVYLKITGKGEPVSPIDGTWRKPYEILLVGRKAAEATEQQDQGEAEAHTPLDSVHHSCKKEEETKDVDEQHDVGTEQVKRRIIIAVPDLHSRKPNLTSLFAPLLPSSTSSPQCLEIFARNLSANNWAWGNEVLKFQSLECWTERLHASLPHGVEGRGGERADDYGGQELNGIKKK